MSHCYKTTTGLNNLDVNGNADINGDLEVDNLTVNNDALISGTLRVDEILSTGSGAVTIEGTDFRAIGVSVEEKTGDVNGIPSTNNATDVVESNRVARTMIAGNWDEVQNNSIVHVDLQKKAKHLYRTEITGAFCEKYHILARDPATTDYSAMFWAVDQTITAGLPIADPVDGFNLTLSGVSRYPLFIIDNNSAGTNILAAGSQHYFSACGLIYLNTVSAALTMNARQLYDGVFRNAYNVAPLTLTFPTFTLASSAGGLVSKQAVPTDTEVLNTVFRTTIINSSTQVINFVGGTNQTIVGTALDPLAAGYGRTLYNYYVQTNYVTLRSGADYLL